MASSLTILSSALSTSTAAPNTPAPATDSGRPPQPDGAIAASSRRRLRLNGLLVVGAILVLLLVLVAIFAPLVAPNSPFEIGLGPSMAPPGDGLVMGADSLGRDLFSRIIFGARTTLLVSIPSVLLALLGGLALGLTAGYFGGRLDQIIMRAMDILLAFPGLMLAIAVVAVLGPSVPNLIITIAFLYTPRMARIARAPVLSVKEREFIAAARIAGVSDWGIITRHVLPNSIQPVIVDATLSASQAIITESALAYLGLGAPPPNPSWGEMLGSSRQFMTSAPWTAVFPGIAIVYATTSFILLGNGLRDWLDPQRRRA